MKIKIEVEIDTKEDISEIEDVIAIVSDFKDKLVALDEGEYYDD
jgi:hypothetical protein